jgi:hypothetical protein
MRVWAGCASMLVATACCAQSPGSPASVAIRPIGTVSPTDATVIDAAGNLAPAPASGALESLSGGDSVKANDHTATVRLARGGELLVCEGTRVHLADSPDESLLLGLDRGSMEVKTDAKAGDVVMTPDLRFTMSEAAPLDLQMRVTSAGDTCVDNRGHRAPTLRISDAFGESTYELKPGQHVTFEHGSLREVVDKETVPCGCPPDELKRGSLADAALAGGGNGKPLTPAEKSAAEHPFPAAVSDGLVPPSPEPPQAPKVTHVTVAASLEYDPNAPAQPAAPPAVAVPPPQAPPPQKHKGGPFGAVGRFFKRLFAR